MCSETRQLLGIPGEPVGFDPVDLHHTALTIEAFVAMEGFVTAPEGQHGSTDGGDFRGIVFDILPGAKKTQFAAFLGPLRSWKRYPKPKLQRTLLSTCSLLSRCTQRFRCTDRLRLARCNHSGGILSCRGRESVTSTHGCLAAVKICISGFTHPASSSAPAFRNTYPGSASHSR